MILDRRTFLKRAGVLAAASTAAPVLTACGGGSSSTAPSSSALRPKRGGTLNASLTDFYTTDTLDPARAIETFTLTSAGNIFEPLVTVNDKFELSPLLAERYDLNQSATILTVRLRQGVEFHNGKGLTSEDVVYSFRRQFDPALASAWLPLLSAFITPADVQAVDRQTVRFVLRRPNAYFPVFLATDAFAIVPAGEKDFTHPNGTGPFKLVSYQTGQAATWTRNPNYWQSGLPYLDGVTLTRSANSFQQTESVISGTVHLIDGVDYSALPVVNAALGTVKKLPLPGDLYIPLSLDMRQPPFSDLRVRQAFKMSIDRSRFAEQLFHGAGLPTPDISVPPDDPFYPDGLAPFPYDVSSARQLLRQAGFANGRFDLYTAPSGPGQVNAATVYAGFLTEVGLRPNVVVQTVPTWAANTFLKKPVSTSWISRQHWAAVNMLTYSDVATLPESHFTSPAFNTDFWGAVGSTDPAEAKAKLGEALKILAEDSGEMIPAWASRVYVAKRNVEGMRFNHVQGIMMDFRRAYLSS